jgi:alpha-ketoglutarate-dependent taurine dioxygenase
VVAVIGEILSEPIGVAIDDIDLSRPLSSAARERIVAALLDRHVVVFPDQALSREQQYEFTAQFGEVELPPNGGDTEFANAALAYEALPEATKRRIAGLRVVFQWEHGRRPGYYANELPPVDHPLVRTHPETGRKALYLGNHATGIAGLPEAEAAALLDELLRHTTEPRFTYAHRWHPGDLVMWDNRCLLHRAVANYEMTKYRRIMHRNVVKGAAPV